MKQYRIDVFDGSNSHFVVFFDTKDEALCYGKEVASSRADLFVFLLEYVYTDLDGIHRYDVACRITGKGECL